MQLIRRPVAPAQLMPRGCVATIGVFDGLHLGHQRILERLTSVARENELPALVFSFEPTPKEYFGGDAVPPRLMRFREKYEALRDFGIDRFFCPPFDEQLGGLAPDAFVEQLLLGVLGVRHLVVGDDFRFARGRSGTIDDLLTEGERHGFGVEQVASVVQDGERVSSTAVRKALSGGDLARACRLLGRYYSMAGRVVAGKSLGKELGYPTANVDLNRRRSPVHGIFAVRVAGLAPGLLDGVASVGSRPTIGGTEPLLEVHLFDFDRDIYGEHIKVEFVAKLREEEYFPDLEALKQQMDLDAAQARAALLAT